MKIASALNPQTPATLFSLRARRSSTHRRTTYNRCRKPLHTIHRSLTIVEAHIKSVNRELLTFFNDFVSQKVHRLPCLLCKWGNAAYAVIGQFILVYKTKINWPMTGHMLRWLQMFNVEGCTVSYWHWWIFNLLENYIISFCQVIRFASQLNNLSIILNRVMGPAELDAIYSTGNRQFKPGAWARYLQFPGGCVTKGRTVLRRKWRHTLSVIR